jgi:hypothetical protein
MNNINYTDLVNIKAISIKGTQLREILQYWDAVDRSYPSYDEFIQSINKLQSLNSIEVNKIGNYWQISNVLYKHMSFSEKIRYFLMPNNELILKILSRLKENCDAIDVKITVEDYKLIFNKNL